MTAALDTASPSHRPHRLLPRFARLEPLDPFGHVGKRLEIDARCFALRERRRKREVGDAEVARDPIAPREATVEHAEKLRRFLGFSSDHLLVRFAAAEFFLEHLLERELLARR